MEVVDELSELVQAHVNRDKVLNLACYALKFVGSTTQRQDLLTASARIAAARSTARLLDDAAAIKAALQYGLGEKDGTWGVVTVAGSVFTLGYLQAEKLGWLIDTGLLRVSKETEHWIKTYHKLFWSLYAFVGFLKSVRALHAAAQKLQSPERTKCAPARFSLACLTSTKLLLDTVHAVSWLPRGWLWGGALSTPRASGIATLAAALGLLIHYQTRMLLPR